MRYLNEHRPEVRRQYNVTAIIVHLAAEDPSVLTNPAFTDPFHTADILLHHPLASQKWDGFRSEEIGLRPSCRRFAMESPQASCFWPFCKGVAETPITRLLEIGWHAPEITRAFDAGLLDCHFAERWTADCARMMDRDKQSDLRAAEFVIEHHRDQKMFFTENHPTMAVLGYMVDQMLGKIGHVQQGAGAALALPLATDKGDNHFPETGYEWAHYGFNYPLRYTRNMGGSQHYHRIIQSVEAEWMQRGGAAGHR